MPFALEARLMCLLVLRCAGYMFWIGNVDEMRLDVFVCIFSELNGDKEGTTSVVGI